MRRLSADSVGTKASKRMFDSAGVKYTQLRTANEELTVDFRAESV